MKDKERGELQCYGGGGLMCLLEACQSTTLMWILKMGVVEVGDLLWGMEMHKVILDSRHGTLCEAWR